jgi:polysaccharide biosynthesis protein PslG
LRLHPSRLPAVLGWLLAAALLAAGFAAPANAAQKAVVTDLTWGISDADQDRSVAALQDLQAKWAKIEINWAYAEPSQGTYDEAYLADVTRAVNLLRARGIQVLCAIDNAPSWASGNSNTAYPPLNPADYATFAKAMAARYAGRVEAWQIWNEPNHIHTWPGGPDAAEYVPLLEAAYPAVKQGDPSAEVVFGGLAFHDYEYLEQAYAAADAIDPAHPLGEYFDVMATHAYTYSNPPEATATGPDGRLTKDTFRAYSEIRATLLAHGDDKPQWLTEIGWAHASAPTQWVVDSEQTAARYLTRAYALLKDAPYVKLAFWYNLRNHWWENDGDFWYDQLGLMRTNFSPKPTYWAFRAVDRPPAPSTTAPASPSTTDPLVATRVSLRVRRLRRARRSRRLKLAGLVREARAGKVRLVLQRRTRARRWRTSWRRTLRVSSTGRFSKKFRIRRSGRWRIRARYLGASKYGPSSSRFVYFRT